MFVDKDGDGVCDNFGTDAGQKSQMGMRGKGHGPGNMGTWVSPAIMPLGGVAAGIVIDGYFFNFVYQNRAEL